MSWTALMKQLANDLARPNGVDLTLTAHDAITLSGALVNAVRTLQPGGMVTLAVHVAWRPTVTWTVTPERSPEPVPAIEPGAGEEAR